MIDDDLRRDEAKLFFLLTQQQAVGRAISRQPQPEEPGPHTDTGVGRVNDFAALF